MRNRRRVLSLILSLMMVLSMLDTSFVIALDSSRIIRTADNGTGSESESNGTENNAASSENTGSTGTDGTESGSTTGSESGTTGSEIGGTESGGTGSEGGSEETGGTGSESGGAGTGTDGNGNESGSNSGGESGGNTENPSGEAGQNGDNTHDDGENGKNDGNSGGAPSGNDEIPTNGGGTSGGNGGSSTNGASNGSTNGATTGSSTTTTTNNASKADPNTKDPETDAAEVDDPNNGSTDAYVPVEEYFNPNIGTTLLYPLPWVGTLVSGFGPRTPFITNSGEMSSSYHRGIDLAIAEGTPIVAAEEGVVTLAEYYGGYGNVVFISHGNGLETRYAHMSQINVKAGDTVKRGQRIGLVGQTGNSLGAHLHFEVIYNGKFVNPLLYMEETFLRIAEVDGITITVKAPKEAFPEDATLSVERVEGETKESLDMAVEGLRNWRHALISSYTFDIKILDSQGNEIQPKDGAQVSVSFTAPELLEQGLNAQVYHIQEKSSKEIKEEQQALQQEEEARRAKQQAAEEERARKQEEEQQAETADGTAQAQQDAQVQQSAQAQFDAAQEFGVKKSLKKVSLQAALQQQTASSQALQAESSQTAQTASQQTEPIKVNPYKAEVLAVSKSSDTATAVTDGFSYYTVEFTLGDLQYVLDGDSAVALADILSELNIAGTVESVEVSSPELFSAAKETWTDEETGEEHTDEWRITAHQPFTSEEWIKVIIDGIEYLIVVTDSLNDIDISGMQVADITIDYSKLTSSNASVSYSNSSGSINFQSDTYRARLNRGTTQWGENSANPTTPGLRHQNWYRYTDTVTIRYSNAATYADGTMMDVLIKVSNPTIYRTSSGVYGKINHNPTIFSWANGPKVWSEASHSDNSTTKYKYAVVENVTVSVVDRGGSSASKGTGFLFTVDGIDGTGYSEIVQSNTNADFADQYAFASGTTVYTDSGSTAKAVYAAASGVSATATVAGGYNIQGYINLLVDATSMSHKVTGASDANGKVSLWDSGTVESGTLIQDGSAAMTFTVPNSKTITYKLTPTSPTYSVEEINGYNSGTLASVDSDGDGNPDYYTYTIPATVTSDVNFTVRWKKARELTVKPGDHASYVVYDLDDNNTVVDSGSADNTEVVPLRHRLECVFTPDTNYALNTLTVDGTQLADSDYTVVTDQSGTPIEYRYTLPADQYDHTVEATWFTREITTSVGDRATYEIYDVPAHNLIDSGTGTKTITINPGHAIEYVFTPVSGYSLGSLSVDGTKVSPSSVMRDTNGNPIGYTYTLPGDNDNHTVIAAWVPNDCADCKNDGACVNCNLAKDGAALTGYTEETPGAHRGGNAFSRWGNENATAAQGSGTWRVLGNETQRDDTFAAVLPYGNIFIDTSKLVWNTANKDGFDIDIADSRFKFIGTGTQKGPNYENDPTDLVGTIYTNHADQSIDGHPFDADLITKGAGNSGSVTVSPPRIAYYGPLHSYLMYGNEKNDIVNNEITTQYARDNTVASVENIAGRENALTYNPSGGGSVLVQNGTNVIVPDSYNTKGYLYRVTYYDAVILQDGSRGDLVLTTNSVQLETNYTTPGDVYIGLQGANELLVDSSYVIEGTSQNSLTMSNRYIPDGRSNVYPSQTVGGLSVRNVVGGKIDIDIEVKLKDGTPVDGIISYALKDLDFGSYESYWGRQPSDTYAGNAGSIADSSITSDAVKNAWTGTHEFYEFAESMKINSGALSYAVIPDYNHASGTTIDTGKVPIDTIINGQIANDGFENLTPYGAPLQVIDERASGQTSSLANGLRFSSTNSKKVRDNSGLLVGEGVVDGANATETPSTYTSLTTNQAWAQERKDRLTFDTGFAVLLDARKSELQWAGSNNSNGKVGTVLFDSTFVQYQFMSHGTGGGVYVEDYELVNNCAPVYRENFVTMPYGSTVRSTIVPEDGYRVNRINYDDIEITINYDWDPTSSTYGQAVSASFTYADPSQNKDGLGLTGDIPFTGNTITRTLATQYNGSSNDVENIKMEIIKNADGTMDVDISDRSYRIVGNTLTGAPATSAHSIHADFDADFYFHKVWEGGLADQSKIPDTLYLTAVPYTAEHDSVTLGTDLYQISKNASGQTVYTNTNTQRQYIVKTGPTTSDPTNLPYTKSDKHPVRQYPIINIEGTIYVIMGNDIYETEVTTTGERVVKENTIEEIAVKFERYVDDSYIKATQFPVTKAAAINSNIHNVTTELTDSDVIWKIRYPSEGDSALLWNELPIEVQDIDAASHDTTETHIKRIYWFVQEDIDKLGEKWMLRSYSNTYDNTGAVMAGIASYPDYRGQLRFKDKVYWYTESTKDFAYTGSDKVKSSMANIDLAYMSPINETMTDKAGNQYAGWGGKITNRIVETKLRAIKQWFDGGNSEYRDALKMTIKRTYQYSQPSTVPQGTLSITLPTGAVMNDLMDIIAGGKANITGFRRDIEPLLADKLAAIEVDESGTSITGQTYTAGSYILYRDQATGAIMYMWFKNGEICYWTDADFDYVFLNADASEMFANMNNLANIPGVSGFNLSKTTNISKMFAIDNVGASLEGLDYLRKWDVSAVTDMSELFAGQAKLYNINGIIDWNVSGVVAANNKDTGFKDMFNGGHADVANGVRVPFLFYPHFFVKIDGDIDVSNSTVAAEDAEDLIYDYDGDHEKNIGTLTENTASDPNEWIWEIKELLASDATKWKYEAYEDAMLEYHSLDGAVKYENAAVMARDGASGYYQHLFQNKLTLYDVTLSKTVTGNMGSRDKYFKFTVDIEDAGAGANITLNTSGLHTQPPSNNAATEASYNTTVYKYVKKNGVVVVSADKTTVENECTLDGGNTATDVIETTVMDAANSRDDDPDSAVIKYSEQNVEKAKKYVWETGTSPNIVRYKYLTGEWHEVDTNTGVRNKISAPDNNTVRLTYTEISGDSEGKEAAKSYVWKDASNVSVTYKYKTDGTGWVQDNGTSETAISAPPTAAYIIFGDAAGSTIAEHYTWTNESNPNTKYEYVSNVWVKMNENGSYVAETPSSSTVPPQNALADYSGDIGQQAKTDANGEVTFELYLQHGETVVLEGLPHGTKYKITEEAADGYRTTIYDGKGREIKRDIVLGNSDIITSGVAGTTAEKDPAGEYYKLKGVDEYEDPRDKYAEFTGDFKTLPHYVKNEDGTYTAVTKGTYYLMTDGKYHEQNPADRYEDLTTTYVLDVTRAYENSAKAAIPTEIRLRRAAVIILPIALLGLIITIYFRRKRAKEEE